MSELRPSHPHREHFLGLLGLLLVVVLGAAVRIETALGHDKFDRQRPEGMVLSDPGLLYYLTERAVEGWMREDLRADPRIEHPTLVDVPARFTVGQELVVAGARRLVGQDLPLHVFCVWVMGIVASLAAAGVYGATWALTRSVRWAWLAAAVFAILPVNYRTIGFVLVREDLSLPLYAAHLWLLARAARAPGPASFLTAGLSLGLAMATWHATAFLAAVEAVAIFATFLLVGRNPFDRRGAWLALLGLAVVCIAVPALRAKVAWLGPAMQLLGAMWIASRVRASRRNEAIVAVIAVGVLHGTFRWVAHALGSAADFSHVIAVLSAKVSHLGVLPANPGDMSFEARMMWQGPFATLGFGGAMRIFQVGFFLVPLLLIADLRRLLRREGTDVDLMLHLFLILGCVGAWLVTRMSVLVGLLLPVLLALAGRRFLSATSSPIPRLAIAVLALAQVVTFGSWIVGHTLPWHWPAQRVQVAAMVEAIEEHVPAEAAVAADFVNSTAILAHTRRPIVFQPKWERAASRERVRALWDALYHGDAQELRRLLLEDFECEYLLLDRFTLLWLRHSRYLAGITLEERSAPPGSALETLFAGDDPESVPVVEGYELLWRSAPALRGKDGRTHEFFRLFRLSSVR